MDSKQFDALTRSLSTRRTVLGGLLGGSLASLLGVSMPNEVAAHNPVAGCRRLAIPAARRRCLSRAAAHRRRCHSAQTVKAACAGRCGVWRDRCGKAVSCPACRADKACLVNGSCSRACHMPPSTDVPCPPGCHCGVALVEGGGAFHCYAGTSAINCAQIPVPCTSTAGCPVGSFCGITGCPGSSGRCIPVCPG